MQFDNILLNYDQLYYNIPILINYRPLFSIQACPIVRLTCHDIKHGSSTEMPCERQNKF